MYVPPEAVHRIFGFLMSDQSDPVQRLQVDLPGLQNIFFESC
jgi:hypothetical protein